MSLLVLYFIYVKKYDNEFKIMIIGLLNLDIVLSMCKEIYKNSN